MNVTTRLIFIFIFFFGKFEIDMYTSKLYTIEILDLVELNEQKINQKNR